MTMMYGYGYDGFSFIWMGLMMFFGLLVTVGVILLVVWLARSAGGPQPYRHVTTEDRDDAFEVARRRYAAGEITKEQYDEIVATLRR